MHHTVDTRELASAISFPGIYVFTFPSKLDIVRQGEVLLITLFQMGWANLFYT